MRHSILAMLGAAVLAASAGCIVSTEKNDEPPLPAAAAAHFRVSGESKSSWLEALEEVPEENKTSPVPWTLQNRITGLIEHGDLLVISINRKGIALLDIGSAETGSAEYDIIGPEKIFSDRTLGSIFKLNNKVLCHIYRDLIFADYGYEKEYGIETGHGGTIPVKNDFISPLLVINKELKEAEFFSLFDAGDAVPVNSVNLVNSGGNWYSANKHMEDGKVYFNYYRYGFYGENAESLTEREYLDIIGNSSKTPGREDFQIIADFLRKKHSLDSTTLLEIRKYDNKSGKESLAGVAGNKTSARHYEEVNADTDEKGRVFFSFRGNLYYIDRTGVVKELPDFNLPGGYRYTRILISGSRMAAVWEYRNFYRTGDAGFSIINLGEVAKIQF